MVSSTSSINYGFNSTASLFGAANASATGATAKATSLWPKIRNLIEFIDGDWTKDVGVDWHKARKAKTSFNFWEGYYDANLNREISRAGKESAEQAARQYVEKNASLFADFSKLDAQKQAELLEKMAKDDSVIRAARQACGKNTGIASADVQKVNKGLGKVCEEAAKTATAPKPGFLGKIFGGIKKIPGVKFIGRHFGPLMMLGMTVYEVHQEFNHGGGLWDAGKAIFRGLVGQAGYIGGTLLATAVLGITGTGLLGGLGLLVAGMGGAMLAGLVASKMTGPSCADKATEGKTQQLQVAAQQQNSPQQPYGPGNPASVTGSNNSSAMIRAVEDVFNDTQRAFNNRYNDLSLS